MSAGPPPNTLWVVLDQLVARTPGGIGRYTRELTRALVACAPADTAVAGWTARIAASAHHRLLGELPGLDSIETAPWPRRVIAEAWRRGLLLGAPAGPVHAPSLLAPLSTAGRRRHQPVVVTIHDAVPWTHPETLTERGVAWHRDMAARASRFADAIVVPTEAVAHQLGAFLDLGDRIRVIGGAPSLAISPADNSAPPPPTLDLPEHYVAAVGTLEPRKGLRDLVGALRTLPDDIHLVHVGPRGWGGVDMIDIGREEHVDPSRIHPLGYLPDSSLATVLAGAAVFAMPSLAEGFGLPVLEAMSLGTPTIISDAPALVEVAGGAAIVVTLTGTGSMSLRLADAISAITTDPALASDLQARGRSRSPVYSWRDSACATWSLHQGLAS